MTEEELERQVRERYRNYRDAPDDAELETADIDITRQSLLPTVKDPKIWSVACRAGKEREVVVTVLQKYFNMINTPTPILIYSCYALDHLKGIFWVEADKEAHVKQALDGLPNIYRSKIALVELQERPETLHVPTKSSDVGPGDWIRVKRGVYRGDIAQVLDVDEVKQSVSVKIVPRVDYAGWFNRKKEAFLAEQRGEETKKRKRPPTSSGPRPQQQLFDRSLVDRYIAEEGEMNLDPVRETNDGTMVFAGQRFKDGFLFKNMSLATVDTYGVQPTLDELETFSKKKSVDENGVEKDDMDVDTPAAKKKAGPSTVQLARGDLVRISEGEFKNLIGTVVSVQEGQSVRVEPKNMPDFKEIVEVPINSAEKYFAVGDHIKVLRGVFAGETGLITKLENDVARVFSDASKKEIKVLTKDIQEASEVSTGGLKLGQYELYDLLEYGASNELGVIVRVERNGFQVLTVNNSLAFVEVASAPRKKSTKFAVAFDVRRSTVRPDDIVVVIASTGVESKYKYAAPFSDLVRFLSLIFSFAGAKMAV